MVASDVETDAVRAVAVLVCVGRGGEVRALARLLLRTALLADSDAVISAFERAGWTLMTPKPANDRAWWDGEGYFDRWPQSRGTSLSP